MNQEVTEQLVDHPQEVAEVEQEIEGYEDEAVEPAMYEVITYPSDPTLEGIWRQWKRGDIYIPEFQRSFVWNRNQASALIDSFLFGLPVPPVFLFIDQENKSVVVDGQQRIKTITSFIDGIFPLNPNQKSGKTEEESEETGKKKPIKKTDEFRLKIGKFSGKTYSELPHDIKRKFDQTVLRVTNIISKKPEHMDLCMYEIFNRLNTESYKLTAQEIRNSVWKAAGFIRILKDLNEDENWRKIFGSSAADRRQRDIEMILRIFALHGNGRESYTPSLKKFLDNALIQNKNGTTETVKEFVVEFKKCAKLITENFGELPCHFSSKEGQKGRLNVQVLEALFCVLIDKKGNVPSNTSERYNSYRLDYRNNLPSRSTDTPNNVKERYNKLLENIIS